MPLAEQVSPAGSDPATIEKARTPPVGADTFRSTDVLKKEEILAFPNCQTATETQEPE